MVITSPYKDVYQYTKIKVEPHQMNSDIRNNMKLILKKKVEKKCNKNGYIDNVYRIVKYSDGILIPENLSACAIFDIMYHCRLCLPIENTELIAQIKIINLDVIIATNGPILIFIEKNEIDKNNWEITDNIYNKKNKEKLKLNDFVKILTLDKRINNGDNQIKSMGKLIDFAKKKEINKYFGSIVHDDDKIDNNNNNVCSENKSNFII